ncbi:hypothetical protein [Bradyrhizobium sp. CCBAU 11445]|uniref:hypothetical protein n=1 Tax=Bradyrhizobium sp. CCBAU 11445 TaxID=1630896 RepID=UPI0023051502|nr:hypothetical protein [Bradyrhizobium sp. CCBAU 11445]
MRVASFDGWRNALDIDPSGKPRSPQRLSTTSPTDHNGYDERSAFLITVDGGKFRLVP